MEDWAPSGKYNSRSRVPTLSCLSAAFLLSPPVGDLGLEVGFDFSSGCSCSESLLERGLVLLARDDENVKASFSQHISIRECCIRVKMAGRHSSNVSALNTVQKVPNLRFHDCSSFCLK